MPIVHGGNEAAGACSLARGTLGGTSAGLPCSIHTVDGEDVLGEIDADEDNGHELPLSSELMRSATPAWHSLPFSARRQLGTGKSLSFVRTQEMLLSMGRVALVFIAALLSACASTYKHEIVTAPSARLERGKAVLIATPKNGAYDQKEYHASGRQTAAVVQSAFARFSDKVVVSQRCVDLPCLQSDAQQTYTYLVVPEILHWEDRNTEWSGIPDRVEIKLVVFDVRDNKEVASTVISGKSKWATFGGDHPQDLLPEPIKQYVGGLY